MFIGFAGPALLFSEGCMRPVARVTLTGVSTLPLSGAATRGPRPASLPGPRTP